MEKQGFHTDISPKINYKKIFLITMGVYIALMVLFFFLAGEQLHLRESRGNIEFAPAEAVSVELTQGAVVEQYFTEQIQRLQSVSVRVGTFGRANAGTVTVELLSANDGSVLLQGQFDASTLGDQQELTLTAEEPLETTYDLPLLLRVYADSEYGMAVTPMISPSTEPGEGYSLLLNGEAAQAVLCFSAKGTDYIWTGLHYWECASALGILLALVMIVVWLRVRKGQRSYIFNAMVAIKKYRFLIHQLVSRDFKTKYKRSILGVFWSFLNPLLMMLVQYFVFSTIFSNDVPFFAAYLIIGTVMFNFFSESVGMALSSILGNANLITKVYMPKYIYPLTRVLSSLVNLAISLIPMLIVCFITGVRFQKSALLVPYFIVCLVIFCLGMGLLMSTSMVFFRDTQFLWNVISMMWMYATPIFYPETILPENLRFVLRINPLYHFLRSARICILNGVSPEPMMFIQAMLIALGMLLVGAAVFYKNQDKFVLYL